MSTEREDLRSALAAQRDHVLGILDGLDDDAFHRAVLPSGWTCAGLVNHLRVDVEQFWFRAVVGGDPSARTEPDHDAWRVDEHLGATVLLERYRAEIARSDAVIAAIDLDAAPAWWPAGLFGDWQPGSLRAVLLHVITETACHAGHLDAVRELIDGRRWLVLS